MSVRILWTARRRNEPLLEELKKLMPVHLAMPVSVALHQVTDRNQWRQVVNGLHHRSREPKQWANDGGRTLPA